MKSPMHYRPSLPIPQAKTKPGLTPKLNKRNQIIPSSKITETLNQYLNSPGNQGGDSSPNEEFYSSFLKNIQQGDDDKKKIQSGKSISPQRRNGVERSGGFKKRQNVQEQFNSIKKIDITKKENENKSLFNVNGKRKSIEMNKLRHSKTELPQLMQEQETSKHLTKSLGIIIDHNLSQQVKDKEEKKVANVEKETSPKVLSTNCTNCPKKKISFKLFACCLPIK